VRGSSAITGGAFFRWSTGLNTLADTSYDSSIAITSSDVSFSNRIAATWQQRKPNVYSAKSIGA
jgi:hypothetical protein